MNTLTPSFSPPTPQQVRRHLDRYPARGPSNLIPGLRLLLFVAAMLIVVRTTNPAAVALACLLFGAYFAFEIWRRRWERLLHEQASQVQDLALLRRWPQSLNIAGRSLPSITARPELYSRTIAMMAMDLDQLKAYESAIITYDFLIDHLPPDHLGSIQFRIQRALAQFALDRLTDGDQALRRLRGQLDAHRNTPTWALYRFALLVQEVRTNHFADAITSADALVEDMRPLGVEAGYAYALMALSYARLALQSDDSQFRENAQTWWSRATMLLPTATLVDRFPDLEFMTR